MTKKYVHIWRRTDQNTTQTMYGKDFMSLEEKHNWAIVSQKKIGQLAWKKNYEIRPRFEIFLLKLTATRKSLRKPFTILISSLVLVMFFSHIFLDAKSTILEGKCSKETLKKTKERKWRIFCKCVQKLKKKYINLKKLTVSIDWVPNSLNTRYCTKLGQTDQINQHRPSQLQAEDERGINETFFWNFFISTDLKNWKQRTNPG